MKVLVIGGSRFVGPYLVQKFLSKGHELTVFNRGSVTDSYPDGVKFVKGDRNASFTLSEKFDSVIDMCAYTGVQTHRALNELKFDYFLHFGTIAAYKKTFLFPLTENSEIGTWENWGDYNQGKVECEAVLKQSGLKYGNVRPVYILGPANYVDREHFIYKKMLNNEEIFLPGNGQAVVHFTFAYDVANIMFHMAEGQVTGDFNVAGDEMITLEGFVRLLASTAGKIPKIGFNQAADGLNHKEEEFPFANENIICSNEKVKSLGIQLTPLVAGIKNDYESYYKKQLAV